MGEWLSLGDVVGGGQLQSCDAEPLRWDGSGAAGLMVTLSKLSERREAPTVSIHGGILECVRETGLLFGLGWGAARGRICREEVGNLDETVDLGWRWEGGLPEPGRVWWVVQGPFVSGHGRKCQRFGLSPGLSFTLDSCCPALEPPLHPGWGSGPQGVWQISPQQKLPAIGTGLPDPCPLCHGRGVQAGPRRNVFCPGTRAERTISPHGQGAGGVPKHLALYREGSAGPGEQGPAAGEGSVEQWLLSPGSRVVGQGGGGRGHSLDGQIGMPTCHYGLERMGSPAPTMDISCRHREGGEKQGLRGTHSRVGPWSQGTQDCLACRSQGCSARAVLRCHC